MCHFTLNGQVDKLTGLERVHCDHRYMGGGGGGGLESVKQLNS